MAENVVQILIQVSAAGAPEQISKIEAALKGAGIQATFAGKATDQMSAAVSRVSPSAINAVQQSFFRLMAAIGLGTTAANVFQNAIMRGFGAVKGFIESSIASMDQMHDETVKLAAIIYDMSATKGPATWASAMAYANAELPKMRDLSAQVGIQWQIMSKVQDMFVESGNIPKTTKDLQMMVDVAKQIQFLAVRGRGMGGAGGGAGAGNAFAVIQEMRQLALGNVQQNSQLVQMIQAQLAPGGGRAVAGGPTMSLDELKEQFALHRKIGDTYAWINSILPVTKEMADEVANSFKNQAGQIKDLVDQIKGSALQTVWPEIMPYLVDIKNYLKDHASEIKEGIHKGLEDVIAAAKIVWQVMKDIKAVLDSPITQGALGGLLVLKITGGIMGALPGIIGGLSGVYRILSLPMIPGSVGFLLLGGAVAIVAAMEAADRLGRMAGERGAAAGTAASATSLAHAQEMVAEGNYMEGGRWKPRTAGAGLPTVPTQLTPAPNEAEVKRQNQERVKAIEQELKNRQTVNELIDDAAQREVANAAAVRATATAYAKLAADQVAGSAARAEYTAKAKEYALQAMVDEHKASLALNADKMRDATTFLDYLKSLNQISLEDQIAFLEREKQKYADTEQEKTRITREQDALRKAILERDFKDAQERISLRYKEAEAQEEINRGEADAALKHDKILARQREISEPSKRVVLGVDVTALDDAVRDQQRLLEVAQQKSALDKQHLVDEEASAALAHTPEAKKQLEQKVAELKVQLAKDYVEVLNRQNDVLDAQVQKAEAINNVFKSMASSVVGTMESGFTSMFDEVVFHGKNAATAILGYFTKVGENIINQFVGMTAKAVMAPMEASLTKMFAGFGGTLGVVSPEAIATQANTVATTANTAALYASAAGRGAAGALAEVGSAGGGKGGLLGMLGLVPSQHGGVYNQPTAAMIGEAGNPEAVIPLAGGKVPVSIKGGIGGGSSTVHIYAWDTATGMEQLYKHRDFLGDLLSETQANNSPSTRHIGGT